MAIKAGFLPAAGADLLFLNHRRFKRRCTLAEFWSHYKHPLVILVLKLREIQTDHCACETEKVCKILNSKTISACKLDWVDPLLLNSALRLEKSPPKMWCNGPFHLRLHYWISKAFDLHWALISTWEYITWRIHLVRIIMLLLSTFLKMWASLPRSWEMDLACISSINFLQKIPFGESSFGSPQL